VLTCVNASDGSVAFRERLAAGGQYEASPLVAKRHLFVVSSAGQLTVLQTTQPPQVVHESQLPGPVAATPAIAGDTIFFRTETQVLAYR
jgi:outer membrane protein assembly factor BamB